MLVDYRPLAHLPCLLASFHKPRVLRLSAFDRLEDAGPFDTSARLFDLLGVYGTILNDAPILPLAVSVLVSRLLCRNLQGCFAFSRALRSHELDAGATHDFSLLFQLFMDGVFLLEFRIFIHPLLDSLCIDRQFRLRRRQFRRKFQEHVANRYSLLRAHSLDLSARRASTRSVEELLRGVILQA